MAKALAALWLLNCVQLSTCFRKKTDPSALTDVVAKHAEKKHRGDLEITCTFNAIIIEEQNPGDEAAEDDGVEWAECTDDAGVVYYMADDDATESFEQGSRVHLVLQQTPAPVVPGMTFPWGDMPFYEIVESEILEGSFIQSDADVKHTTQVPKVMKVVSIVCNYNDYQVDYIDEQGIMDALYLTEDEFKASGKSGTYPGSMSDMIAKSSYGKVSLPRSEGKVVTIEMGKDWGDITDCPVGDIAQSARTLAREQHPDVDFEGFHFWEYFIPKNPRGGCHWGGLASVGCGHYQIMGKSTCDAWYRAPQPFVRAHELGHNLGLKHAGGLDKRGKFREYGDPEASMGASYRFSSFIASARYQSDFLEDKMGQVVTWEGSSGAQWKLQSLSLPLGQEGANAVAIRFECSACVPKVARHKEKTGGNLWVQFRGDEGYSAVALEEKYQNKVYVHLARNYLNKRHGKGSELWAQLDVGEHYETPDHRFVHVCAIDGDLAKVAVGPSLAEAQEQCSSDAVHTPAPTTPAPTLPPETEDCKDRKSLAYCLHSLEEGNCRTHRAHMKRDCRRTCNMCSKPTPRPTPAVADAACEDKYTEDKCQGWAKIGLCKKGQRHHSNMMTNCKKSCGECKVAACEDEYTEDKCQGWAKMGLCKKGQRHHANMMKSCKKSCGECSSKDDLASNSEDEDEDE